QTSEHDAYYDMNGHGYSSSAFAISGANKYATTYGYDDGGSRNMAGLPTGTKTYSVFDIRGHVISIWVGTDDSHTGDDWTPGTNTGNMVKTTDYEYDGGGIGDGLLTSITQHPGSSQADRVTDNYYDWRDRLVLVKNGVQTSESTSDNTHTITYYDLDNLGELTSTEQYD